MVTGMTFLKCWSFFGLFSVLLTVFLRLLSLAILLNYWLNRNNMSLKAYVYNWPCPACLIKKVMPFKQVKVLKLTQFFGNFLTLRESDQTICQVVFNGEIFTFYVCVVSQVVRSSTLPLCGKVMPLSICFLVALFSAKYGSFSLSPLFKLSIFVSVLRVIMAIRVKVKHKSTNNCWFVHRAKFDWIMTT